MMTLQQIEGALLTLSVKIRRITEKCCDCGACRMTLEEYRNEETRLISLKHKLLNEPQLAVVKTLSARDIYKQIDAERRNSGKRRTADNVVKFGSAKYLGQILGAKPDVDYRREILKYPDNTRLFGIELEVEFPNAEGLHERVEYRAPELTERLKQAQLAFGIDNYICRDGSLHNGIEIVTAPRTIDEILCDTGIIKAGLKNVVKMGGRSHDTQTCGLHIHVSKSSIPEQVRDKVRQFIKSNRSYFLKISRRNESSFNQWCSTSASRGSRYRAVNETSKTLEFRIFRGTLKSETFFAAVELVDAVLNYLEESLRNNVNARCTFKKFALWIHQSKKRYIYLGYQLKCMFPDLFTPVQRKKYTKEEREQRKADRLIRAEQRKIEQAQLLERYESERRSIVAEVARVVTRDCGRAPLIANNGARISDGTIVNTRMVPVEVTGLTQQQRRVCGNVSFAVPMQVIGDAPIFIRVIRRSGWGTVSMRAFQSRQLRNRDEMFRSPHLSLIHLA